MKLTVRLFAVLRERAGTGELSLDDLPEPLDVAGLKRALEARHPELGSLAQVAGVVGTRYVRDDTRLAQGDAVALLPPVSGGAPGEDEALAQGLFELSAEPFDVGALHARLVHASCGGVVTFTGTTRGHNRGKPVERLDYEAFHEMAGPEMARIFAECRAEVARDDPERALRMLCVHRTGTVGVGEPSVFVGVASPHRDAAFAAARRLIDRLKERLPVWKKEVYADGHHWVGDRS